MQNSSTSRNRSQSGQQGPLSDALVPSFQYRTPAQHRQVDEFISEWIPTMSPSQRRWAAFFIEVYRQGSQLGSSIQKGSQAVAIELGKKLILNGSKVVQSSIQQFKLQSVFLKQQVPYLVGANSLLVVLQQKHAWAARTLQASSMEEEMAYLRASPYLCSISRKKILWLMRSARVRAYLHEQKVYEQGQSIDERGPTGGVYFVRSGQFVYLKHDKGRDAQVFKFGEGHMFGVQQILTTQEGDIKRQFTVVSRSSKSIVYQFTQEVFLTHIREYCESHLHAKQKKISAYLQDRQFKLTQQSNKWLSKELTGLGESAYATNFGRSSLSLPLSISGSPTKLPEASGFTTASGWAKTQRSSIDRPQRSLSQFYLNNSPTKLKPSQLIEAAGLAKTSLESLRQGPLKDYPSIKVRSLHETSQFRDLERLQQKRSCLIRIKQIKAPELVGVGSRGEVLYQLFKDSWAHERRAAKQRAAHRKIQ